MQLKLESIPILPHEPSPKVRLNVCLALSEFTNLMYARHLEESIFISCIPLHTYKSKSLELLEDLRINSAHLFETASYSPSEVMTLSPEELRFNTPNDTFHREIRSRHAMYMEILSNGVANVDKLQAEGCGLLICRSCKSSKVTTGLRQTRSADEGMSVFASCLDCNARWKMG